MCQQTSHCGYIHAQLDMPDSSNVVERNFSADLNRVGAKNFVENNPDFYGCEENAEVLENFINSHGGSGSERNFAIAYQTLKHVLIQRPVEPEPVLKPETLQGVPIIFIPDSRTADTLETFADKKYESDVTRKKRDERLRQEYLETLRNKGEWSFE